MNWASASTVRISWTVTRITTVNMVIKRINTLRIKFNRVQQRPQPAEIHEFLMETLHFTIDQLYGIQFNSLENTIYVKLVSQVQFEGALRQYEGAVQCKLFNGDLVDAIISNAGLEDTYIRLFNLPFEASDEDVKKCLAPYGKIRAIVPEHWSKHYRVNGLYNGLRAVTMELSKPVPSFLHFEGYRVQVIYEGQPRTCHACNQIGHVRSECPQRNARNTDSTRNSDMRTATETLPGKRLFAAVVKPATKLREELKATEIVPDLIAEGETDRSVHSELDKIDIQSTPTDQDVVKNSLETEQYTSQTSIESDGEPGNTQSSWAEDIDNSEMEIDVATKHAIAHTNDAEIGGLPVQKKSKMENMKESDAQQVEGKTEQAIECSKNPLVGKEGDSMFTVARTRIETPQAHALPTPKIKTIRTTKEQEQINRHPYTSAKDPRLQNKK